MSVQNVDCHQLTIKGTAVHESVVRERLSALGKQLHSSASIIITQCPQLCSNCLSVLHLDNWHQTQKTLTHDKCTTLIKLRFSADIGTHGWLICGHWPTFTGGFTLKGQSQVVNLWHASLLSRVCTVPHFHLFCWMSCTHNFLTAVVIFGFFHCLYM